jgi:transcriptional regulator
LDLLILSRLAKGAMHGFGVAEYLHQVSDALHVEEGSLYPALHRLESHGFVESEWRTSDSNRRARYYQLTPRGRKQVTLEISKWRRLVEAVNRVIDPLMP